MPHKVFISYSSKDKEAADTVCSVLEKDSIPCWMAPRDITPGVPFADAIMKAIKESKVFIVIYSSSSNQSPQVIKEVDRAVHHRLDIITLRLEDVPMSDQLEYYISNVHWLDAMTPPLDQHINQLSKVVRMLLAKDEVKDEDIEKAISTGNLRLGKVKSGSEKWKNKKRKTAIIIAIAVVMAIATLLIVTPLLKHEELSSTPAINKSIAVLPFDNLSDDPEQEYFSDGLVEEILNRLCRIGDLKVISRTSSSRFKGSELSLKEIAAQLGASAILEGSVQKSGNRIRIAVQLIDAQTDVHMWSNIFEQDYSDIFHIYSVVAQFVADQMEAVITPEEKRLIENAPTSDITAYDAYLKGTFYKNKLTREDLDIAMQFFELAKERDPGFALAWSGIASVWIFRQQMGIVKVSEAAPLSEAAIMKALELDSTLSDVHGTQAGRKVWTDWDWEGGETAFRKAIEIEPNNAGAHSAYSHLLNILGRPDEAMKHIKTALELDPMNPQALAFYGIDLMFVRRFDEAVTALRHALELSPRHGVAVSNLDEALYYAGRDQEEVMDALRNKYIVFNEPDLIKLVDNYYPEGGWPLLHKKIAELRIARLDSVYSDPLTISDCYTHAGDIDNAMYWMEKAYEEHDPNLPYLLLPTYDTLRSDPRFQDLADRMDLPYK